MINLNSIKFILKNYILGTIIGIITFSLIGISAASKIQSNNIRYSNNTDSSINNVKQAIDILNNGNFGSAEFLVSPNSINLTGTGSTITARYRNDNFSGKIGTYYNSLKELINAYGPDNFKQNPYYIKTIGNGSVPCVYYNNREFCNNLQSSGSFPVPNPLNVSYDFAEALRESIKKKLNITPSCSSSAGVSKCSFGGLTCGIKVSGNCATDGVYYGCSAFIQGFCGKCSSYKCMQNNIA